MLLVLFLVGALAWLLCATAWNAAFQMDECIGQLERMTSFRGTIAERAQAATFANVIFRARRNGWLMRFAKTHFARAATRRPLQTAKYLFNK